MVGGIHTGGGPDCTPKARVAAMILNVAAPLLTAALLILVAANVAAHSLYLMYGFDHQRGFRPLVDMSRERNLPSLYSGALIFTNAAALAAVSWRLHKARRDGWMSWCFLAAVFVYLSIDETVGIHEHLTGVTRQALNITSGPLYFAWVLPGMAFALIVFLLSLRFLGQLDQMSRLRIVGAGAIYVSGAVGMEMLGGWRWRLVGGDISDALYIVLFTVEETLEIAGMSLMLYAVLRRSQSLFAETPVRQRASCVLHARIMPKRALSRR